MEHALCWWGIGPLPLCAACDVVTTQFEALGEGLQNTVDANNRHQFTLRACLNLENGWAVASFIASKGSTDHLRELVRNYLRGEMDKLRSTQPSESQVGKAETLAALILQAATGMSCKALETLSRDCLELKRVSKIAVQTTNLSKAIQAYKQGGKLDDLLLVWNSVENVSNSNEIVAFLGFLLTSLEKLGGERAQPPAELLQLCAEINEALVCSIQVDIVVIACTTTDNMSQRACLGLRKINSSFLVTAKLNYFNSFFKLDAAIRAANSSTSVQEASKSKLYARVALAFDSWSSNTCASSCAEQFDNWVQDESHKLKESGEAVRTAFKDLQVQVSNHVAQGLEKAVDALEKWCEGAENGSWKGSLNAECSWSDIVQASAKLRSKETCDCLCQRYESFSQERASLSATMCP
eukprot:1486105-Amphidinium_carterae.9